MKKNVIDVYDAEGRRKYLSKAEGRRFLQNAALLPKPQTVFCLTIYYTGCRISEALNLRTQDVDIEVNAVLIRSLKKRERRQIRRIPVPAFLVKELIAIGGPSKDLRIWNFSRSTAWRLIKSVMRASRVFGIQATTKGLRHAFGVRAVMAHLPVTLIQSWMGHSDPETTAIYLAVKDDEERVLIKKTW